MQQKQKADVPAPANKITYTWNDNEAEEYDQQQRKRKKHLRFVSMDMAIARKIGAGPASLLAFIQYWSGWKKKKYGRPIYFKYSDFCEEFQLSESTIRRYIERLESHHLLARFGNSRTTYYEPDLKQIEAIRKTDKFFQNVFQFPAK